MKIRVFILVATALIFPQSLVADNHKKESESSKTHYFEASFTSYIPGGEHRAYEIIDEYWFPTDKNVGRLAIPLNIIAGEWDHVVLFYRPEGLTDFQANPDKVSRAWEKDVIGRLGEKEFLEIQEEFNGLISKRTTAVFKLVGELPKINESYFNLGGKRTPVSILFETYKLGKNTEGFKRVDQFRESTGIKPIMFRSLNGEYDQISIWKLPNEGKNLFDKQSEEMKKFMRSDAMQSYFSLLKSSDSSIGTIQWKYWEGQSP